MEQWQGVCQDYVYVLIICVWVCGLLLCYVLGYLYFDQDGQLYDVVYVWVEVYVGVLGWVGFDVVNVCCLDECYVWLGLGYDVQDVVLVCGMVFGIGVESLDVCVYVEE